MKFNQIISATALALTLGAGTAHAGDAAGKFSVRGAGSAPCSAYTTAVTAKDEAAINRYASWILGYVSAYNRLSEQTFDAIPGTEGKDVLALTMGVCQSAPTERLEQVLFSVLRGLNDIRLTSDTAMVTLTSDGKTRVVREETLRYVERRLKDLGFYKGAETGKASPQIVQAIKAYQTAQKMPVDGLPNMPTLLRILRQK